MMTWALVFSIKLLPNEASSKICQMITLNLVNLFLPNTFFNDLLQIIVAVWQTQWQVAAISFKEDL